MSNLSAWDRIEIVRQKTRPTVPDYIGAMFDGFVELHGDRRFGDDCAVMGGVAFLGDTPVTVIGTVKGKNLEERKRCNFGMPNPEGYRKALRLMEQAGKFKRPVVCLIDTPGANPSVGAEERGQGEAIARNLYAMMRLPTPVVSVILGEAGSGGALALAVCDMLLMQENAVYSVISPRGFASILWKDPSREKEASGLLRMTAHDLVRAGVADRIVEEPRGGAHRDPKTAAAAVKSAVSSALGTLACMPTERLLQLRYEKFRKVGIFSE